MNDAKSLVEMVGELQKLMGEDDLYLQGQKPLVVMDAGLGTKANLEALRKAGFSYLVNDSRQGRKRYRAYFETEMGFAPVSGRPGKKGALDNFSAWAV